MKTSLACVLFFMTMVSIQCIKAQEVHMTYSSRSIKELIVVRQQGPALTGVLLDFEQDALVVRRGALMKKEAGYSYYNIHTTTKIPVSDLKSVSFRKTRFGAVLVGALSGLVVGGIIELANQAVCLPTAVATAALGSQNDVCKPTAAPIVGTAIGAGIGLGISFAINPTETKVNGNPLVYRQMKS